MGRPDGVGNLEREVQVPSTSEEASMIRCSRVERLANWKLETCILQQKYDSKMGLNEINLRPHNPARDNGYVLTPSRDYRVVKRKRIRLFHIITIANVAKRSSQ